MMTTTKENMSMVTGVRSSTKASFLKEKIRSNPAMNEGTPRSMLAWSSSDFDSPASEPVEIKKSSVLAMKISEISTTLYNLVLARLY